MTLSGTSDFELDVAEYTLKRRLSDAALEVRTGYDLKNGKAFVKSIAG